MPITNLHVSYLPVRIGFVVEDGNISDYLTAVEYNALLWNGIFNPIIPISATHETANRLVEFFHVDVLYAIGATPQVKSFVNSHVLKKPSSNMRNGIFDELHIRNNGRAIGYASIDDLILYYWREEFKHKLPDFHSDCLLVIWDTDDSLNTLFAATFGNLRTKSKYQLNFDYETLFEQGLRANRDVIEQTSALNANIARKIYPFRAQWSSVEPLVLGSFDRGCYVGRSDSFDDLVNFWNLRAAGADLQFLAIDALERTSDFVRAHLQQFDIGEASSRKRILIAYHSEEDEQIHTILEAQGVGDLCYRSKVSSLTWVRPDCRVFVPVLHSASATATEEKSGVGYSVSVMLPENKFFPTDGDRFGHCLFMAEISSYSDFEHPGYTLKPPCLNGIEHFVERKMCVTIDPVGVSADGIRVYVEPDTKTVTLYPASYDEIIAEVLNLAGIKSEVSHAGRIARRLLEQVGGLENSQVFTIPGVRSLLSSLKAEDAVRKGNATELIFDSGSFKKRDKGGVAWRWFSDWSTARIFESLIAKGVFRAGLRLNCTRCNLDSWISLKEIDETWICEYCGQEHNTSLFLNSRGDWLFRKSGLFGKDNNQEGSIPVALTLLTVARGIDLGRSLIYAPCLNLTIDNMHCETDLFLLSTQPYHELHAALGECKSPGSLITQEDIEHLMLARSKLMTIGLNTFLIFGKTADSFDDSEILLFKSLVEKDVQIILLTNYEFEREFPYYQRTPALPHEAAITLGQMAVNSKALLLRQVSP